MLPKQYGDNYNDIIADRNIEKWRSEERKEEGKGEAASENDEQLREELVHSLTHSSCCLLYTSPSPRDRQKSRMPSSA